MQDRFVGSIDPGIAAVDATAGLVRDSDRAECRLELLAKPQANRRGRVLHGAADCGARMVEESMSPRSRHRE
jgi:hypothetical protein